jgi:branched-chain amino acid transport system substrate-binding protein
MQPVHEMISANLEFPFHKGGWRGIKQYGDNMKKIIFPLFLLLLITILPHSGLGQQTIKVGGLIPFSGRWGDSGRECAKGMLDAGKWLNQRGGIYGRKLEIFLINDSSQPAEIVAAYRKLNEADHILLLYIYSTETGLALLPHFHFNRIPTLVSSFPSQLTNPSNYPYVFSITPTPLDLAKIGMNFISEKSNIKMRKPKIVFIGSPDHFGRHFLQEAQDFAKSLGFDVGPDIWISDLSSKRNISFALTTTKAYEPDFAYLSLTSKEASLILQEAIGIDLRTKWICNMRAFDENLVAFDGVLGVQPIAPFGEDIPGMVEIKEAHQKWHPYDSHTLSYVEGWATVQVISEAVGRSLPEHGFSCERVKWAFEGFRNFVVGGLIPPLTITAKDHRPSVESRIFIVKEGKLSRYTSFISISR